MSIWILLWLFLSLTLLYFFAWMIVVVQRQKKAWKKFASKFDLRYRPGSFFAAPEMRGVIKDYEFSFFPAQYEVGDVRHNRKMTAIEVVLKNAPPFNGFIASGLLVESIRESNLPHEYKPKHEKWSGENVVITDKLSAMEAFLTPKRLDVVTRWMHRNNIWFLIGFVDGSFLLRVDTPLPLDDPKRINSLVKMILKDISAFEMDEKEYLALQSVAAKDSIAAVQSPAEVKLEVSDDDFSVSFELEDE